MPRDKLRPDLWFIRQECVLIQAWKKTSNYIRYHNSFCDTLDLDHATVNLPEFIEKIQDRLASSNIWKTDPLRLILVPKIQNWKVTENHWRPVVNDASENGPKSEDSGQDLSIKFRPLAHVSLEDQVIATAVMLCIADRVESKMGDPREKIDKKKKRKRIVAYGSRLFCDEGFNGLEHRWGSSKLYRSYFQDFRKFLARPIEVARHYSQKKGLRDLYVVEADLSKFYDRVTPELLDQSLTYIQDSADESMFFEFAKSVFHWEWDSRDHSNVEMYAHQAEIDDFDKITLPQGLVASGFMSNLVLLRFDKNVRSKIGKKIDDHVKLLDFCRYVDDFRIVVAVNSEEISSANDVKEKVWSWLNQKLQKNAPDLKLSKDKTKIFKYRRENPQLLPQTEKMKRIQTGVSGGFDAQGGIEILDAIQGLIRTQREYHLGENDELSIQPDVRDVTVIRFSAARFRRTFRSIRTLFPTESEWISRSPFARIKSEIQLDQEARSFAFDLIQNWITDPSNVRLLRIGLDLWSDVKYPSENPI